MSVLFSILMNFFVDIFGKVFLHAAFKIAITLLFISLMISAIYAYIAAYRTIVSSLNETMPEIVLGVWGWFMPPNIHACIVAIVSSVLLKFATKQYFLLMNARFRAAISN